MSIEADGRQDSIGHRIGLRLPGAGNSTGRSSPFFTEELTKGGTVVVGDAVRRAKLRYFLETPRYDVYDEKSLMEWTLFGLPMYGVKTGIAAARVESQRPFDGTASILEERAGVEEFGGVVVERSAFGALTGRIGSEPGVAIPDFLTQLNLHFNLSAQGVYVKRDAAGDDRTGFGSGCPGLLLDGSTPNEGCYYTLNGLVERSSGAGDLPIQPYFIYDSRLGGGGSARPHRAGGRLCPRA